MKKICFFIVSHGKLDCIPWQVRFFNKFKNINNYDIIIYDNSNLTEQQIFSALKGLNPDINIKVLFQKPNPGYFKGQIVAINECFDTLKEYEMVVHQTVDTFIINDNYLRDWIRNFKWHDAGLMTNQFLFDPARNSHVTEKCMCLGTDIFIFNPIHLNKKFWEKMLTYGNIPPELCMYYTTKEFNTLILYWIRVFVTKRGQQLCSTTPEDLDGYHERYFADTMNILHTHDLNTLEKYL